MKDRTKEKATRVVVSSLLEAGISAYELKVIGDAFIRDREFSESIGSICLGISTHLRELYPHSQSKRPPRTAWTDKAKSIAKRKRMPKRDLIAGIQAFIPDMPDNAPNENNTISEILAYVEKNAPKSVRDDVLHWMESGGASDDEYLKGIMDR